MKKLIIVTVFLLICSYVYFQNTIVYAIDSSQSALFPQYINPYNLPEIIGNLIDIPNNIKALNQTSAASSGGIDLMMYIIFSTVYIMFINFAVGIKSESNIFWVIGYFLLGGVIGGWLHTYEGGFVFSIIMSLIFC